MIQLRLLGDVAIVEGGRPIPLALLGEPTRFAILAHIASCKHPYACREELKRLLWPDAPRPRAQNALRQALHRIRSELGSDALVSDGMRLEVNHSAIEVDVVQFQQALSAGCLREALDFYRGDFLEGFPPLARKEFDDWVQMRRMELRDSALHAAQGLAVECEAAGALRDAAHWWHIAVGLSPFDEGNLRRWMRALTLEGSPGRALKAFEDAARRLHTELETRPAGPTRALAERIRAGDALGAFEVEA